MKHKNERQLSLHTSLANGLSEILRKAKDNEDAVVDGEIDQLTNVFSLVTKGGNRINVGKVGAKGEPGEDGVYIVDVQLVEDPEQDNNVFIETELSDGVKLQSRTALNGYHGLSIETVGLDNANNFIVTLEGGVQLDPIPVSGLRPVSVNGVRISAERELFFQLDNGEEMSAGVADDLKGRGVVEVYRQAGRIYIKYDDDPNNGVDLGTLVGIKNIEMIEGKLIVKTDDDQENDLGPLVSIERIEVVDGEMLFHTNQADGSPQKVINIGPVQNLRGKDGLNMAAVDISDNVMTVTLNDGSELDPINVTGLRPIHVIGARYSADDNEVYFQLSDSTEIPSGIGNDFKGDSIEAVAFDPATGEISVKFDRDSTFTVIGNIPTPEEFILEPDGKFLVKWSHLAEPLEIGSIVSLENISRDDTTGMVTVTLNTGSEVQIGAMRSIEAIDIDGDDLIVTITGQDPVVVGSLRGAPGADGISMVGAEIDQRGYLILEMSDGEEREVGYVRTTVQNVLGNTSQHLWGDGPDFPVVHEGNVIMFVGKDVIPVEDLGLAVEDTVGYKGTAIYDPAAIVTIVSFVMTAPSATGRGIFKVENSSEAVYDFTLEDGTVISVDTETVFDETLIPAAVVSGRVDQETSQLILTLDDETEVTVSGKVNNSDNTDQAYIDENGIFHIVLDSGKDIEVGSVISNITIVNIEVNQDGELEVWLSGASEPLNAGPIANYVTGATIDQEDRLVITTSDGRTMIAGTVRNPVQGTIYEFGSVPGQTKFRLDHSEYKVDVSLQGIGLFDDQLILDDPQYIELVNPIKNEGQRLRVTLFSKGTMRVTGLESELTAPNNSFYGIDDEGNAGFHPVHSKLAARPKNLAVENDNETELTFYSSGLLDVYKNGQLMHDGYSLNQDKTKILFAEGLMKTDKIRVIDYSQPQVQNGLLMANYGRVGYRTFSAGGTFTKDDWRVRSMNFIESNQIGLQVRNNRIILESGIYYVEGWAACRGVGQNQLKLFNESESRDLLAGGAQFCPKMSARQYEQGDVQTRISGYFQIDTLSAVLLMHRCAITGSGYGFGAGNTAGGAPGRWDAFDEPGRLVDLQLWRVGEVT